MQGERDSGGAGAAAVGGRAAGPAGTVADRLRRARRSRWVGREAERHLFRQLLRDPGVLYVYGPGGMGKTTLLRVFAELAAEAGRPVARLDARTLAASPATFQAALPQPAAGQVLMLDTYELLAGIDDWLRESYLPALPADVAVVIAGREPPAPGWLTDPGWRDLLRVVSLRNFRPEDSAAYLRAEGVPPALHARVQAVTYGHPLALSLVAELLGRRSERDPMPELALADSPDLVRLLLEQFVAQVPDARHRQALEICAHARFTTEDLLRAALPEGEEAEAGRLFDWLRRRSFVEEGTRGIFPHDLVRDVLEADLRWRDPAGYRQLHQRVRAYVIDRIAVQGTPLSWVDIEQQQAATDLLFLHRNNPVMRSFVDFAELGRAYAERPRLADRAAILAMVSRHQGDESAALAGFWLDTRPEWTAVFRAEEAEPIGFTVVLRLDQVGDAERTADPVTARLSEYVRRCGIRPGEQVLATRFFLDREHHQAPSRSYNLMSMLSAQLLVTHPGLAMDVMGAVADPEQVAPLFLGLGYYRATEAEFTLGGQRYGVFANDFRQRSVTEWLAGMADVELGRPVQAPAGPPLLALSQPEFADAVRRALRDLHRPDALAGNPLLRSRLIRDRDTADGTGGSGPGAADLVAVIDEAAETMRADPREERLFRAVDRTYLRPAATQERAAEVLGLPFSTYRRHLTRGVERLVELLWHRELHGAGRPQTGAGEQ